MNQSKLLVAAGVGCIAAGGLWLLLRRNAESSAIAVKQSQTSVAQITQLWVYPVKSCGGVPLTTARLDTCGVVHDRKWMVVRTQDRHCMTQRDYPKMRLLSCAFQGDTLVLSVNDSGDQVSVPLEISASTHAAIDANQDLLLDIHRKDLYGKFIKESDQVNTFLSTYLEEPCFLARQVEPRNPNDNEKLRHMVHEGDRIQGQEHSSLHIVSEEGMAWIRLKVNDPSMTVCRFRPNIVVAGAPFPAEDNWGVFTIGDVKMRLSKWCGRCLCTTVNDLGVQHPEQEPNTTLKQLHAKAAPGESESAAKAAFGIQVFHENNSTLMLGDSVVVLESWKK